MWQTKLIKLYCAVCDNSNIIEAEMQRQSNNFRPQFSDEECITIYLWGISQRRFEQKTIYEYTRNHLLEWFPKLPSYQAFSDRLNRLAPVFQVLAEHWLLIIGADLHEVSEYIVDSCPVILAKGSRSGHAKVARELCQKSYNSSRKEWYYGLKLHAVVARRPGRLPAPLSLMASGAAMHDLPAAKWILEDHLPLSHGWLYADKAYMDAAWAEHLEKNHALVLLTPRKKRLGDVLISSDTFSTFVRPCLINGKMPNGERFFRQSRRFDAAILCVWQGKSTQSGGKRSVVWHFAIFQTRPSSLRQPVECFFNWLNRLTNIQSASLVRSLSGLLLHIFARIAAALAALLFNS